MSTVLFSKLDKFTGNEDGMDLNTYLRNFDRCCLVAGKTDDTVKGQLLLLMVEGQAKAVLEEMEELAADPQKYSDLTEKLRSVFDTPSARECKMMNFERRTQRLDESEEEFMFDLLKLFRQSNPWVGTNITDSAVKRKFLQGISPTLKRGLFVFCNAPVSGTVSRDQLLQYCREAKSISI